MPARHEWLSQHCSRAPRPVRRLDGVRVDNITHSLTGLLLSRAGLDRLTPRAPWILFLAANAPDIDVVSAFGGSLNYLHYHRNLTHSLVALPVLPIICVL
ncbi:MAG: hypothetical protein DMG58_25750 [Acidobacteria bacterium]|nr:MAG: hypothetical protein DMG58_25750 [Acidobacteriota bacterium]